MPKSYWERRDAQAEKTYNKTVKEYMNFLKKEYRIAVKEIQDEVAKWIARQEEIESINPNWSNATNYLLVDENNHIYGCSQFRHHILGELVNVGGNFAYAIRPSERGKGYGTIQLKLLIEKAKEFGLEKVLVTCRENNIGSKKTMEKFIGEADTLVP